jgi:hypothetical protein
MCQGSSYRLVSYNPHEREMELHTKITEEIRYKPVVAAIESTTFLKMDSLKTSEKVRPPFSCASSWIPLTAMKMVANWMIQHQNCWFDIP